MGKPWGVFKIADARRFLVLVKSEFDGITPYDEIEDQLETIKIAIEAVDQVEYLQELITQMDALLKNTGRV